MGSSCPSGLDNFAEASPSNLGDSDTSGRTHSERHDDVEAAVEQIEETLGTLPQGSDSTVRDRIAGAESDAAAALTAFNTHTHASTPPALAASGGTLTGALLLPDGSAAAPSLSNADDTNTGLLFPAADAVAVSTGGTERFRVDSSGNVGIGTSSPAARLHIEGDTVLSAGTGAKLHLYKISDTNTAYISSEAGGGITFTTGTSSPAERMRISEAGNVGIGTSSPSGVLEVRDNTNGANLIIGGSGTTNVMKLWAGAADALSLGTNGSEFMRIETNGLITGSGTSLGAWTAYTPTITASTGTFTTVVGTGWYCQIGKTVLVKVKVVITTNGTAADYVIFTLPSGLNSVNTAGRAYGSGREIVVTGKHLNVEIPSNAGVGWVRNYDNTYPGASGYTLHLSATYEAA